MRPIVQKFILLFFSVSISHVAISETKLITEFETVGKGIRSKYPERPHEFHSIKIEEQKDWKNLWEKHIPKEIAEINGITLPDINFEEFYIIAAFDQKRASGGYSFEIKSIRKYGKYPKALSIDYNLPINRGVLQSETRPYHIIKVKK